ncbi:ABC transporter substrate-binding protein [Streptomyces sp. TR06-5]|uniref:ABC transporter substrate-binding protein n=1 Tax=unclassified Streptomyces TaxID=2593676 RepID=UPI0039A1C1C1
MTLTPRRRTAAAVALAGTLALTGCGSDTGSGSGSGSADAQADGTTHAMDTAMGKVEVPEDPERVVVLDTAELDSALTLGVTPVGATVADASQGFLDYFPEKKLSGIEQVGTIASPNLEKIASLEPDLILSSKIRDAQRYDELSAIAPTVLTETTGYPWKENFLVHAKALGRTDEAEEVVDAYDTHVAETRKALGGSKEAAGTTVSMVRFIEGADTRLYGRKNYIGTILDDLGVGRPAIVDKAEDGFAYEVSPEQVDKGDADVVFYSSYGAAEKSGEAEAVDSPLWKNLSAVRNGNAFHVEDDLWFMGIGYTAADRILDEMATHLAG